jgi:hypothetical protein
VRPLTIRRVAEIEPQAPDATWLIENIWLASGVGLLGGQAKVCKTYLAAELSLAVASGIHALGHYPTHEPGPVLFYGAEDSLAALRSRFDGLATSRGCDLQSLRVFLIDVPVLRLDTIEDLQRLRAAIGECQPRLLVLDPFVRLVGNIDENSAADVSAVLGSLRAIQREHQVAILLVHHARKSPAAHPNQAYRGSSDFAAWSDSNLFIARRGKRLTLTVEHRSAPSPEPIQLSLEREPAPHLVINVDEGPRDELSEPDPLAAEILRHLERSARPITTVELRKRLRRRKSDVVEAIEELKAAGSVQRAADGWQSITRR